MCWRSAAAAPRSRGPSASARGRTETSSGHLSSSTPTLAQPQNDEFGLQTLAKAVPKKACKLQKDTAHLCSNVEFGTLRKFENIVLESAEK